MRIYLMLVLFFMINKIAQLIMEKILKIIIALGGPLVNAIIIIVTESLKINIFTEISIITTNLMIIIFSLIPVYPTNGGKILEVILNILIGKEKGEIWTKRISFAILILITVISSIAILYLENILVLAIIIYLWYKFIVYYKN